MLSPDDTIRRWTIRELMCNFHVSFAKLLERYGVVFEDYFAEEIDALKAFEGEGFVTRDDAGLTVLPLGQVFVRNIAMVFDAYLKGTGAQPARFSRTV